MTDMWGLDGVECLDNGLSHNYANSENAALGDWPKNALKVWLKGLRNGWPLKAFEDRWPCMMNGFLIARIKSWTTSKNTV